MGTRGPVRGAKNAGRPAEGGKGTRKAKPSAGSLSAPLKLPDVTKLTRAKLVALLQKHCGIRPEDVFSVDQLWRAIRDVQLLRQKVDAWLQSGESGGVPAEYWACEKAEARLDKALRRFPSSPADRARIGGPSSEDGKPEDDEYTKYLQAGAELMRSKNDEPTGSGDRPARSRAVSRKRTERKADSGKARKASNRKASARSR